MEITYVMCDLCNPDWDANYTAGTFCGVFEEAYDSGWRSVDYGHLCPTCVAAEKVVNAPSDVTSLENFTELEGGLIQLALSQEGTK